MHRLAPLALLLLAACGGDATPNELVDAGNSALGKGDSAAALSSFEDALASIGGDTADPLYFEASLGSIEARSSLDPGAARDAFLALAETLPDRVTDREFNLVGGQLGNAGAFDDAVVVLEAGMARFPESPHLGQLLVNLGDSAKKAGATGALKSLQGLGYVGDE